uniref:Uncharacterized protein n=1 Tax=Anopheles melas TaxID=34690 RepID=A0A182U5P1_9DIPT
MPRSLARSLSNVLSAMATDRTISPTGAFSVTVLDPLAEQISSRTGWVESLKSTPSIPVTLCPGFSRPIGAKSFTAIPAGRFPFLPISMSTSSTLPWFVNVSSTETMRDEYRWGERTKRYSIPSPNPFTLLSSSCFLIGMKLGPTSSMPVPAPAVFVAAIGTRLKTRMTRSFRCYHYRSHPSSFAYWVDSYRPPRSRSLPGRPGYSPPPIDAGGSTFLTELSGASVGQAGKS